MGYAAFGADSPAVPSVIPSPTESRAFGLPVGRLDYGLGADWSRISVGGALEATDSTLVIVRYPAWCLDIQAEVQASGRRTLMADTLLYYRRSPVEPAVHEEVVLRRLLPDEAPLADELIADVFADYRNHYLSNPLTRSVDLVAGYQEWTRASLDHPGRRVFAAGTPAAPDVGICVVEWERGTVEVLLAGLRPAARGRGTYQGLLRRLSGWALEQSHEAIVISTQAWNIAAMRAWSRTGYLPELALSTLHVMRDGA